MTDKEWLEIDKERFERIQKLELEVSRLKRELRDAKNKLYTKNRTINKMKDDDFNKVDLG